MVRCPNCKGRGGFAATMPNPPFENPATLECARCGGSGSVVAPYDLDVAKALAEAHDTIEGMKTEMDRQQAACAEYREALEFYAGRLREDENGYEFDDEPSGILGTIAREALAANPAGSKMLAVLDAVKALNTNRAKCTSVRGITCSNYPDSSIGELVWNVCKTFRDWKG